MFNLDSLALKTEAVLHVLKHPVTEEDLVDEKGEKVGIYIFGTASKEYRNAINAMQNRHMKRNGKKPSAEVVREEAIELTVAVSEKATDNLTYKGKPLNTPAAFRELYNDPQFGWIKSQMDEAVGNVEAFLDQ